VIGCGRAAHFHASALRRLGWRPVLAVDPDAARAEAFAAPFKAQAATAVTAAFDGIDAAIVATPPERHAAIVCPLIERGVGVLVEKPMATLVRDAETMLATAAANPAARLWVGNQRRQLAGWRWVKQALDAGLLGSIAHFSIEDGRPYAGAGVARSFWRPGPDGGGALTDLGPHGIDLMHWWFGRPVSLEYRDDHAGTVETDAVADVRLASGLEGRIAVSQLRHLSRKATVVGTRGEISVDLYSGAVAILSGDIPQPRLPKERGIDAFERQLRLWRHSLLGEAMDGELVDARAGLDVVAFIRRCYAARRPLRWRWRSAGASAPVGAARRRAVVVTGAGGFIGGRAVEMLLDRGDIEVRPVVRSFDRCVRLARLPVDMTCADFGDPASMRPVLEGADTVLHAGFDPRATAEASVSAALALADAAAAAGVRRFVHVSSTAVYEPFPDGTVDEATGSVPPPGGYALTKWRIERAVLDRVQAGLAAVVLQPGIVYGPFGRLWTDRVVQAFGRGTVAGPAEADGWCNAVHVDDVVQAMLRAMEAPDAAVGEAFIVTGPDVIGWADYFDRYAAMIGTTQRVVRLPAAHLARSHARRAAFARLKSTVGRLGDTKQRLIDLLGANRLSRINTIVDGLPADRQYLLPDAAARALYAARVRLDPGKAMALLGYRPVYDVENGLAQVRDYVRWAYPSLCQSSAEQGG